MTEVEIARVVALFDDATYGEVNGRLLFAARIIHRGKTYERQRQHVAAEHPDSKRRGAAECRKVLIANFLEMVTPSDVKALQAVLKRLERGEEIGI